MYVPDKLKLNKFQLHAIPKPKDYVSRFGFVSPQGGNYSGDNVVDMNSSKVHQMSQGSMINNIMLRRENMPPTETSTEIPTETSAETPADNSES